MQQFTEEVIINRLEKDFEGENITILAPVVRGRKGHYRELFEQIRKQGFSKVRVNGVLMDLVKNMRVERYKTHDIEVVIDRIKVLEERMDRMRKSIQTAFEIGDGLIFKIGRASCRERG